MKELKEYKPPAGYPTPIYFKFLKKTALVNQSDGVLHQETVSVDFYLSKCVKTHIFYRNISTIIRGPISE